MLTQQISWVSGLPLFALPHHPVFLEGKYCLTLFPPSSDEGPIQCLLRSGSSRNSCLWWWWWRNSLRESDFTHVCWLLFSLKQHTYLVEVIRRNVPSCAHLEPSASFTHAAGLPQHYHLLIGVAPYIGMCLLSCGLSTVFHRHCLCKTYPKNISPTDLK